MASTELRLRELREAMGLTQVDLAALVGTSQRMISRLENGAKPRADLDLLVRICQALEVTMADLVPVPKMKRRERAIRATEK